MHDIGAYSATPGATAIAATLSTQTTIGDIFVTDLAGGDRRDEYGRRTAFGGGA